MYFQRFTGGNKLKITLFPFLFLPPLLFLFPSPFTLSYYPHLSTIQGFPVYLYHLPLQFFACSSFRNKDKFQVIVPQSFLKQHVLCIYLLIISLCVWGGAHVHRVHVEATEQCVDIYASLPPQSLRDETQVVKQVGSPFIHRAICPA